MKLNDTFDHIYCINLDVRTDRWEESKEQFDKYSLDVERVSASTSSSVTEPYGVKPGEAGLIHTHQRIFADAIAKGYGSILVLEDDVEFAPDFEQYLDQIPKDWDMIFLGGNHHVGLGEHVSGRIYKAHRTLANHAVGFNARQYQSLLDNINYAQPIDSIYADILHTINSYVFNPVLAWQRASWSDLMDSYVDYKFLRGEQ